MRLWDFIELTALQNHIYYKMYLFSKIKQFLSTHCWSGWSGFYSKPFVLWESGWFANWTLLRFAWACFFPPPWICSRSGLSLAKEMGSFGTVELASRLPKQPFIFFIALIKKKKLQDVLLEEKTLMREQGVLLKGIFEQAGSHSSQAPLQQKNS